MPPADHGANHRSRRRGDATSASITAPSDLSAYELYATAQGFFVPTQEELTPPYVAAYFAQPVRRSVLDGTDRGVTRTARGLQCPGIHQTEGTQRLHTFVD